MNGFLNGSNVISACVCECVCVSVWVGQLSPGRFLPVDLSTQPLPNPTAEYHSRSLLMPCVERTEDGGNMQQQCLCHESLFSRGSGKPFPPSLTCCFPRTFFSLHMLAGECCSPASSLVSGLLSAGAAGKVTWDFTLLL